MHKWITLLTILSAAACASGKSLADFQQLAAANGTVLAVPHYPVSGDEIRSLTTSTLEEADKSLVALAALGAEKRHFENTFVVFDAVIGRVANFSNIVQTVAESSTDKALRYAANEMQVKLNDWLVGVGYREDIYKVLKSVSDSKPQLDSEAQRLVNEQMRDYRRSGLDLPVSQRAEVEKLFKEMSALNTQFAVNINESRAPLDFTREELAGVPDSFLESPGVRQADGRYRVMANVTWQAQAIANNVDREDIRRQVLVARNERARQTNLPVLVKLVKLRNEIAHRLGYASWADYQIEVRMAKTGAAALAFEEDLVSRLQPKFDAEAEELRKLKVARTGKADAKLMAWDVAYYIDKLQKSRYSVDTEKLRVFFPYQQTLNGMFAIYEKIFGLKFSQVEAPYVWVPGVQLYVVSDGKTGNPMGMFYLDMFPREGKFNHFACFPQVYGGFLADGNYQLPVDALLCNFPSPSADKPSLLKHEDVVTLFHEFGHVMHGVLSRSRFFAQTAFQVPKDFVEAPSQMLENWPRNKAVLDTFAADYRDPTKKIPSETIDAMEAARVATAGFFNRRQLSFGLVDLSLHGREIPGDGESLVTLTNNVMERVWMAPPTGTNCVTDFGHLAGYDAGYYGYMWAEALALDMASEFKVAPNGFLDEKVGRKLRDEVYAVADTRDVSDSVEKFLGRPRSSKAFLEYIGAKP